MDVVDTLYGWWLPCFESAERSVLASGVRSSPGYEGTRLVPRRLSKRVFLTKLQRLWRQASVKQAWIDRFVSGHEQELQRFPDDARLYLQDCTRELPPCLGSPGDGGERIFGAA